MLTQTFVCRSKEAKHVNFLSCLIFIQFPYYSNILLFGNPPQHIAQLTGHKNTGSLLAYTDADIERQRKMSRSALLQNEAQTCTSENQRVTSTQTSNRQEINMSAMNSPVFNNCVINITVSGNGATLS